MTKPSHLTLGVSAGGALRRCKRRTEWDIATQVSQKFGQADRLHCREAGIDAACGECRRLGKSARLDHLNEPGIAGGVKAVSRRREQYRPEAVSGFGCCLLLPSTDGYSSRSHHFKGADEPLFVSGKQTLRGRRIEPGEPLAKRGAAQHPMKFDRLLPDLRGDFWNRRQTLFHRA